ncbi:hypothetical protein H6F67_22210 [Microcoleus sp. FACHB-1515]|uniref:hypothetical protein n=1 Tax=Cyanophyceae TaxID=3028117 RepID=UPI001683AD9F|nr:hypothetical protein [Microcoleus sp. FACHB-1515]MBD2092566.1 hypothetical protein [Microcoleus sp. FACHB-1515]
MAGFFGENFQGLSQTEKLGIIAALMQVVYQCEFSEDWTLHDELESGRYNALSPQVKGAILAFDEDDQTDAIAFCTAVLLKLAMQQ